MTREERPSLPSPAREPSSLLVVISILNWNGWRDTLECLESVRVLDYPNYLTVVVDNGSGNDSVARIRDWAYHTLCAQSAFVEYSREAARQGGAEASEAALGAFDSRNRLVLIRNEENLGFTGGHNVALHYALARRSAGDFVFLLNNDALVTPNCLTRLVTAIQKASAGVAEPAVFSGGAGTPQGPWIPPAWQVRLEKLFGNPIGPFVRDGNIQPVSAAHGAALLMPTAMLRELFAATGEYLPERFFMYLEDVAISLRAAKLGYKCIWVSDAEIQHRGAKSAGGFANPLEYYYSQRNSVLLSQELSKAGKLTVHLVGLPKALGRIAKCFLRGRLAAARAVLSGLFDGYRGVSGKWKRHDEVVRKLG